MDEETLSPLAERVLARIESIERRKVRFRSALVGLLLAGGLLVPFLLREERAAPERAGDRARAARTPSGEAPGDGVSEAAASAETTLPDEAVLEAWSDGGRAGALAALQRLVEDDALRGAAAGLAGDGLELFATRSAATQRAAFLEAVAASPADVRARLAGLVLAGLGDPTARVRAAALRTLVTCFPADRSHPVLDQVLDDRARGGSAQERYAAAGLLAQPRFLHLSGLLERLLSDDVPRVRSAAAHALGALDAHDSADRLRPLLDDPDVNVRAHAARSLGLLGNDAGASALQELLRHPDPAWQAVALGFLADIGDPAAPEKARELLASDDVRVRQEALRVLAETGAAVERSFLDEALSSGDPDLRLAAGRILLAGGTEEGADVVRESLDDPVRVFTAAELLLRADPERFAPEIRARLEHLEPGPRRDLLELLHEFEVP